MIIAITTTGNDLSSQMDPRFGRAHTISFYDTENKSFKVITNEINKQAKQGAGIQTAQFVAEQDTEILITGNLGPKAFRVLEAAGITSYTTKESTVQEAIDLFAENKLEKLTNPSVEGHWI
ncbi:MAG: NifB/NifX family molybdenum-iron cluster-binding protein [Bacteriovoracaceae bacterium]|nr:NifB/NifX family molybdenum-iron cluster-binding protein [Bacteriovoracaceae bacterium]